MKDGLSEQINPDDNENLTIREKVRQIPLQGGIVDVSAAPDALVNNNNGAYRYRKFHAK